MDYLQDNKMSVNKEIKHTETDYSQKPKTNVKNNNKKRTKQKQIDYSQNKTKVNK